MIFLFSLRVKLIANSGYNIIMMYTYFPFSFCCCQIFLFVNIIQSASYSFCMKNEWKKVIENFGCAKKGCTFAPAFWEQRAAEIEKLNRERLRFFRIRLLPFARESVSQVASKKKFWKKTSEKFGSKAKKSLSLHPLSKRKRTKTRSLKYW